MDEIKWIKLIKKAFILITKIFGVIGAIFVLIGIYGGLVTKDLDVVNGFLCIAALIVCMPPVFFIVGYGLLFIIKRTIYCSRTVIDFSKEFVRELPKNISPALVSLIYDLKIDVYKDYTATILYLCIKKYLIIGKTVNTYELKLGEQNDYDKLSQSERYVLDLIINKAELDENAFKKEILKEAQEKNLITDEKYDKVTRIVLMCIVTLISLIFSYFINMILFYIILGIIGTLLFSGSILIRTPKELIQDIDFVDTGYKRTKEGKELALLLNGFKRYIKEYTLIKEKDIEYVRILDEYIPYALSLDEADAIEEFIKENEEYRDLIYNRK